MTEIKHHAYLFDATRCIDCRACMVACSVENNIDMDKTRIWVAGVGVTGTNSQICSAARWSITVCTATIPTACRLVLSAPTPKRKMVPLPTIPICASAAAIA